MNNENEYICYTITHNYINTYVGITNNFTKRLKQHNHIIKGGAKATQKYNDWELIFYISGFNNKNEVLSFEWHMHHPNGKRKKDNSSKNYYGVLGRVRAVCEVLNLEKFSNNRELKINMCNKCYKYIEENDYNRELMNLLESFIEIIIIDL
jgi:predicted GIY-YIG superfamily endonuclease